MAHAILFTAANDSLIRAAYPDLETNWSNVVFINFNVEDNYFVADMDSETPYRTMPESMLRELYKLPTFLIENKLNAAVAK